MIVESMKFVAVYGALLVLVTAFVGKSAGGREKPGVPPEGSGLAAKYSGDAGIERNAAVIFTENFETGDFAEIVKRWGYTSIKNGEIQTFSGEVPPGSAGRRSLQMGHPR